MGDFGREELAQGVNLALLPTPMLYQARSVQKLTQKHNDQHFLRWRNIQVPLESHSPEVQKAQLPLLAALDAEEAQMVVAQRAAAQPKSHRFELSVAPAPVGPNLALRKPYVSSDPNVYGYGLGALTDGDWSGDGHTFASGDKDAFPKTVTIDLGAVSPLTQVRVGLPDFGSTKTVTVLVSADGQTFKEVGSYLFPLATTRRHIYAFDAVPARYVRLLYPDHYGEEAGFSKFFSFTTEVEAYGPRP